MDIDEAVEQIKSDPEKIKAFAEDPRKVLSEMGIDVDDLTIGEGELEDGDLEDVAGGAATRCQTVGRLGRCQMVGV